MKPDGDPKDKQTLFTIPVSLEPKLPNLDRVSEILELAEAPPGPGEDAPLGQQPSPVDADGLLSGDHSD